MAAKPTPLSGFPELLPAQRAVEQHVIDLLRRTFELHGFAGIETRAVEPMDQLLRKGDTSKEVYVLRRLHEADAAADSGIGLHFDLTVPFARYVLENAGRLEFPFRRYQVQKAWRGERPQDGRYREFTQADIDVIGRDELPFHHDLEIARVMVEALSALDFLPPFRLQVNNRKLIQGFYTGIGVGDVDETMRVVDKLDKLPAETLLRGCRQWVSDKVSVVADLSVARGLDYYTGTVFETRLEGSEHLGSICSGGRYDALASDGRTTYPGVGISLGVSRVLVPLFNAGSLGADRSVPSAVLVALADEGSRSASDEVAARLRANGIACEVAASAQKFGKQIRYAERRGIPFVWFVGDDGGHEVKDIRSGEQVTADPESWAPPVEDLRPRVLSTPSSSGDPANLGGASQ